ncbi:Hsp20/alpha crystallin family protein [Arthrobacter bambusae]
MSDFLRHVPFDVPEPVRRFLQGDTGSWLRVEEFSEGSTMVIRAELPGVDPDRDIDISVSERTLTIDARRNEVSENQGKANYRSEFRYGEFTRSFQMPGGVNEEDIQASYSSGILEVRVPLSERESTPRRKVPVHRTDTTGTAARGTTATGAETMDPTSEGSTPAGAGFVPGDQQPPDEPQEESPS